jgi:hypothetical protein
MMSMARQVHITNGDSVAGPLRDSGLGGAVLAWRAVLFEGPLPADDERFAATPAEYLASAGYADHATALQGLKSDPPRLRDAAAAEEAVLWFEHDLHDQVQLAFLLDWYARQPMKPAPIS